MPHLRGYAPDVPLADLDPGARVEAASGTAVVVGPVGAHDDLARCLRSVVAHTGRDTPVVVVGGADARAWLQELAAGTPEQPLCLAATFDDAVAAAAPADVVLLHPACTVAQGWLGGLRDAAGAVS